MPRHADGTLTTAEVAELVRVSYRQLDHWVGAGMLSIADRSPGSGSIRRWTPAEVAQARVFAALQHAGVAPAAIEAALPTALIGDYWFAVELGGLTVTGELP